MRLIVHLHAYYTDHLASLLGHLAQALPGATYLITTSGQDQYEEILSVWRFLGLRSEGQVLAVPNIGRNVAPLLFRIGPLLSDQDLVLHVHTKKSPHLVGPRGAGWQPEATPGRKWLLQSVNSLAFSPGHVLGLVRCLEQNPQLGVLYPPPFLPLLGESHWGANRLVAEGLLQRLALSPAVLEDLPLQFPMGMMFWFRPPALRQLFAGHLTLEDFAPEPIGTDGTLAHAIERCLLHIAWSNGYRSAMIRLKGQVDPAAGLGAAARRGVNPGMPSEPDGIELVPYP